MTETEAQILDMIASTMSVDTSKYKLLKMDLVMKDAAVFGASATLNPYRLFSEETNTGKDAFSRTHKFPLQRGRFFSISGVRASHNVNLSLTVPGTISTTVGLNQRMFENESYFEFRIEKTTLNPIPLNYTLPYDLVRNAATIERVNKEGFQGHFFGEELIVPASGDIGLRFVPRTGLQTLATAATNPFRITDTTAAEAFEVAVELIGFEYTLIAK